MSRVTSDDLEWLVSYIETHEFLIDGDLTPSDRGRDSRLIGFLKSELDRRAKQSHDRALVRAVVKTVNQTPTVVRTVLRQKGMIGAGKRSG